jgi:CheY-like chemotaxis protein
MAADIDFSSPRSLLAVISSALTDLAREAKALGVDLAWTVDPSLPAYISVNRVDLFAIVSVLVRRALEVLDDPALHLTIASANAEGSHVLLQIEDLGSSKRKLDKIAWRQLEFWVEDLRGKLTREAEGLFWSARLPLDRSSSESALIPKLNATGLNVLVVCPDTDTRSKILQHARHAGHEVIECKNRSEATKLAKAHRFHLVMIDADLGDSDGVSLAKMLISQSPKLLIALMSTDIPTSARDFSWIKLWMHKPPRESELNFAFNAAKSDRRQRLEARLRRSITAEQSA